jgi:hypothetical protein
MTPMLQGLTQQGRGSVALHGRWYAHKVTPGAPGAPIWPQPAAAVKVLLRRRTGRVEQRPVACPPWVDGLGLEGVCTPVTNRQPEDQDTSVSPDLVFHSVSGPSSRGPLPWTRSARNATTTASAQPRLLLREASLPSTRRNTTGWEHLRSPSLDRFPGRTKRLWFFFSTVTTRAQDLTKMR